MLRHYPFKEHRPGTREALIQLRKAFDSGKRFVLVHGPTGSGKSGLAIAAARSEKAVILTPTKLLQDQYESTKEFSLEYTIKGKSNYKCGLESFSKIAVDRAICCSDATTLDNISKTPWADSIEQSDHPAQALKARCVASGTCPYYCQLANIGKKPGAVMNYDLFFNIKERPDQAGKGIKLGSTLIMDEAHQLLGKIKSIFGFQMSNAAATKVLGPAAKRQANESPGAWLTRLSGMASQQVGRETQLSRASELSQFNSRLERILTLGIDNDKMFHIEDSKTGLEIKPLNMRYLKGILFYPFDKIVMLSATFPPNFCDLLGLKPDEVEEIHIPSTFSKENRPVIYIRGMEALNYKTALNRQHPSFKALAALCRKHKGDKGIIHCSNYRIFNELKKAYPKNSRLLWVERGANKTKVLEKHAKTDKDTILVSPSMLEGVDLKDDLARFQIMLKLPFSTLDDYTRKMIKIYEGYYESEVILNITQAYGRAVRTADDYAAFYILDGAFSRLLRYKKLFQHYFVEAFQESSLQEILEGYDG